MRPPEIAPKEALITLANTYLGMRSLATGGIATASTRRLLARRPSWPILADPRPLPPLEEAWRFFPCELAVALLRRAENRPRSPCQAARRGRDRRAASGSGGVADGVYRPSPPLD